MLKYSLLIFILLYANCAFCQQDSDARIILERVAEKTKSYKSIQADFELVIEDRKENIQTFSGGQILLKGNKYKVESMGSIVYFDGKTIWTYTEEFDEVIINEPDSLDDNFISNPAKIFYWYNRDFKYRYVGESLVNDRKMHEIDLYPRNLDQPYSRFKIFIDVDKDILSTIKVSGKDGIDYLISIKNYITNNELDDSIFTFDESKHKKAEIIDLREN